MCKNLKTRAVLTFENKAGVSARKPNIISVLRERLYQLNPLLLQQKVPSSSRTLGSAVLRCGKTCRNPPKRERTDQDEIHILLPTPI